MNFKIEVTKVNVTKHSQSDLSYYIATLFCMGIKLTTQSYTTFKIHTINNITDVVKLISLQNSNDAQDKGDILGIALKNNLIEYDFKVNTVDEYSNDYGEFKIIKK